MHATRTEAGTHTLLQRPWGDNNAKWKVWCTKTGLRMYTLDVSISSNLWKTTFYVQYTMILCVKTQGEHMPCFVLLFYLDRAYELELTKLPLSCSHISGYHYKMRGDIRTCVAHSASKWIFLLSARKRETNYCHLLVHILVTMLAISCTTLPITPLTTPPSPCLITRTPLVWNVIRLHPLTSGCVCVWGGGRGISDQHFSNTYSSLIIRGFFLQQPGEETEERENLAQMAAQALGEGEEEDEDESVLRKYSKGISHVESLLALDRLRQVQPSCST